MFLLRRIGPWCIAWHDSLLSEWHLLPIMWHALGLLIFMPISTRMLRRRSYSLGSRAKLVLWWPLGSSAVGTTIHPSGSSFIVDLSDLSLLCTKSRADSLVMANLVSTEWSRVRSLERKLCTSIPPSLNPTFGSWTRRIVDDTIFIWLWMVNPNGAAWFRPHNPATTVFGNHERCHSNPPRRCRCLVCGPRCSPLSWTRIVHP
jgi:hypothetical protein